MTLLKTYVFFYSSIPLCIASWKFIASSGSPRRDRTLQLHITLLINSGNIKLNFFYNFLLSLTFTGEMLKRPPRFSSLIRENSYQLVADSSGFLLYLLLNFFSHSKFFVSCQHLRVELPRNPTPRCVSSHSIEHIKVIYFFNITKTKKRDGAW